MSISQSNIKRNIFSRFNPKNVNAIVLFGSRARGEHNKNSDYDVNVFLNKNYKNLFKKRYNDFYNNVYVDFITPHHFTDLKEKAHSFLYCTFRDGIPLYQKNKWFEKTKQRLTNLKPSKETAREYISSSIEILTHLKKIGRLCSSLHCEDGKIVANKIGFGILMDNGIYPVSPHTLTKQLISLNKRYEKIARIIKYLQDKYYKKPILKQKIYIKKINILRNFSINYLKLISI